MNLFNSAIRRLAYPHTRSAKDGKGLLDKIRFGGASPVTDAGRKVSADSSLKLSAFWCGVNTIADTLAMMPKHIYVRQGGRRDRDTSHPVGYLIHNQPNEIMTAFTFWKIMAVSQLVRGNAYARIHRNNFGQVESLEYINPNDVDVYKYDGELFYKISGNDQMFLASEIYHVPNFSWNGVTGIGVVQVAADNLGMSLSADRFAADNFSEMGVSYGVIETDTTALSPVAKNNLKNIFEYNLSRGDRHHVSVLDEGMKYKRIALSMQESQFIETKTTGIEDIARWLNLPLHKLKTKGEGGYNFLVQMSIEYMQGTIMPLAQPHKEEIERKLLSAKDRENGRYVFVNYRKLLEVDPKTRSEYLRNYIYAKVMSPNEARRIEDMNPYDGGDEFLQMVNMQTQEQIEKEMQNG